ncbi:hypothetical protein GE09DRAFT_547061 [Coniochaeta sp. 2T2.1]|nr:hypothetical protein GE09DRAFT_547061 [Coniochaeta sp. 2T2.1]
MRLSCAIFLLLHIGAEQDPVLPHGCRKLGLIIDRLPTPCTAVVSGNACESFPFPLSQATKHGASSVIIASLSLDVRRYVGPANLRGCWTLAEPTTLLNPTDIFLQ